MRRGAVAGTVARMANPSSGRVGAICAATSAILLFVLVVMTIVLGESQQSFEVFSAPPLYAAALVAGAASLRAIVLVDDLFICAYTTATVLFIAWIAERRRSPSTLLRLVLGLGVTAGLLDWIENHHILAMIRMSELGFVPSAAEIEAQMVASSLKWIFGHVAFAMIGVVLEGRSRLTKAFRVSLVGIQLPLGVLPFVLASPRLLALVGWLRYGNLIAGFVLVAYLMSRSRDDDGAGSGAPA